ncbi:nucleotide exchange factor GrpE [Dermabacteraceae bacterium TAE3-ERU27]|nr:nucleotide exchange factor GrpE [Dermabacteraceae bacterium TAE3-ERU27]
MADDVSLESVFEELQYLRNLFARRLNEDKQKEALIRELIASNQRRDEGWIYADLFKECLLAIDRLDQSVAGFEIAESVRDELLEVFRRRGLEEVRSEGKFDARYHEAVEVVPASEGTSAGDIVEVKRSGYSLSGKILRPARVVVAKA